MTTTPAPAQLEATIDIAAPPARVWSLVTDVRRMASWSPQVLRTVVLGGSVRPGARFVNLNHRGLLVWPTTAKVVRFEPHRDFAFRIAENHTIWSFGLAPIADPDGGEVTGTRLTQRRETPEGIAPISNRMVTLALGGIPSFTDELRAGMTQTLDRVKVEAERA